MDTGNSFSSSFNFLLRCGHCKQFAPEYEKIASTLKDNDPPIAVAKIDATSASMLASRFDVSGYPTIKILKKGQAVDYEGSRTQEGERQDMSCWGMVPPHAHIHTCERKHMHTHTQKLLSSAKDMPPFML